MINQFFSTGEVINLDFRLGAVLPKHIGQAYSKVREEVEEEYELLRFDLARHFKGNKDWWFSEAAFRNDYVSPIFQYCVAIALVSKLRDSDIPVRTIAVDSRGLYSALKQIVGPDTDVRYAGEKRGRLYAVIFFAKTFVRYVACYVLINKNKRWREKCNKPVTLIDTFVLPGYEKYDRYFPGLTENLNLKEREPLQFVPDFVGFSVRETQVVAKDLRKSDRQYLLKEDVIKLVDIIYALNYWFRRKNLKLPKIHWKGSEISLIICEELYNPSYFRNAVNAWINYLFFKKLSSEGVKIQSAIDWFENQPPDAGWNLGMKDFFRDSRIVGYQGFYCANQSMIPSIGEIQANIIPNTLYVMGEMIRNEIVSKNHDLDVRVAPAFRFSWLWGKQARKTSNKKTILVVLPIDKVSAVSILNCVLNIDIPEAIDKVLLKPHPVLPLEAIICDVRSITNEFIEVSGDIKACFLQASVVIGGGHSSASLEAMAYGLPVLVYALPGYTNLVPLPQNLKGRREIVYTDGDHLKNALNELVGNLDGRLRDTKQEGPKIRQSVFSEVTEKSIRDFVFGG